jgi:hypothetical protein
MIEIMQGLPEHVLGFTVHATVTGSDYESILRPELEARFKTHTKLCLLYHFSEDFSGFDAKAIWEDIWTDLRHFAAWEKIAVVTDSQRIHKLANLFGLLRPGRARVFTNAQLGEAFDWVNTDICE